jgi:hypothetical protein
MFYDYIIKNYKENEPILVADIQIDGMTENNIRQQIMRLTDSGKLKRYDTGIYYIPKKSVFKSGSFPAFSDVVERKYLRDKSGKIGYITGLGFANMAGVTTQVPNVTEVATNRATKNYKETTLGKNRVVIRMPKTEVTDDNALLLQFLDLLKDINLYSEIGGDELKEAVISYMQKNGITFNALMPFLDYYPEKIYKNMYEAGVLNAVSTQ